MMILRGTLSLALAAAVAGAAFLVSPNSFTVGAAVVELQPANALLVLFVSALVVVVAGYSTRNLLGQDRLHRFGALLLTAFAGLIVMVTAGTLAQFAIGWTVSGQATALLVAHAGSARARRASAYVRNWLLASDALVWLAVLASALPNDPQVHIGAIDFTGTVAGLLLVLACIVRTGLVPAHRWLAQTAEAPSPVSAFLHAGIINAAAIAVVLWLPLMRPWLPVLLLSACVSVAVGLWTIKARTDVKGKLASSTSTQMAFMSIEAAVGLPGLALLHLIGHGSYKSWCFLRAGGAITRTRLGHRSPTRSLPVLALAAIVACAAIAAAWALLGSVDALAAAVGLVACFSVIAHAAGAHGRQVAAIAAISGLALSGYLLIVHAWLAWLPVPHWQDTPLVLLALASLVVGAGAPLVLPRHTLHRVSWYLIAPRWMRAPRQSAGALAMGPIDADNERVAQLHELVDAAAGAVAPTWPLRTAVAINPLQSLTGMSFSDAATTAAGWGASLYPSPERYLQLLDSGEITPADLEQAAGGSLAAAQLIERTQAAAEAPAEGHDDRSSAAWEEAHRWCQLAWGDSEADGDCFALWHRARPRGIAQGISPDPVLALHQALAAHGSSGPEQPLLTALLTEAPGWAAHAHWRGHDALVQLLALRACLTALYPDPRASGPNTSVDGAQTFEGAETWQRALEASFDRWLATSIDGSNTTPASSAPIGVVTCIDVRSEPMRRALERSASVRTFGAAGFFGIDASLHINDTTIGLAPVILEPSVRVDGHSRPTMISELAAGIDSTMSGVGGLAIAEGYGLGALVASILNTFAPGLSTTLARFKQPDPWLGSTGCDAGGLPVPAQVAYARGFLDALGTQDLPALVAVAGHGAHAANNAFAAAYDCGACGGNTGTINARMVVSMLNNPPVREQLIADGYALRHTLFVAALHLTTTSTLVIDPATVVPATHEHLMAELLDAAAAAHARLELADAHLPGPASTTRGLDWAQPFPEWGLVGNAACIIGPRQLTASADLGGRVFLHEYDWTSDPEGVLLRSILQGPGVVMHMINMQYFCSTTDPSAFGSQDKTRHNVVGDTGVLVGASGDLHYGLPWQSLGPEPDRSLHLPVRLRLLVAAPPEVLDAALGGTALEQLAANGWLTIAPIANHVEPALQESAQGL